MATGSVLLEPKPNLYVWSMPGRNNPPPSVHLSLSGSTGPTGKLPAPVQTGVLECQPQGTRNWTSVSSPTAPHLPGRPAWTAQEDALFR